MRRHALALPLLLPASALAGMPSFALSDVANLRLEAISFFALGLLLLAAAVRALWNALAADVPALPRLGYKAALAGVVVFGLAFHLVLTMISGARELMTPGAWTRDGVTYTLTKTEQVATRDLDARRSRLTVVRDALMVWADAHDGRFPDTAWEPGLDLEVWPGDPRRLRYELLGGRTPREGHAPLAWEPGIFGEKRLVLYTDGTMREASLAEIQDEIRAAGVAAP